MSSSFYDPKLRPYQELTLRARVNPRNDGNKGVLSIPHNSSTTGVSPSDAVLCYYQDTYGGVSCNSVEM